MKIGNLKISENSKPIIIAEIAQSHCGSYKKIIKYIDKLSLSGVDVIKFQTHYAIEESTLDEPFRKKISKKYKNRFEYWKKMEFSEKEWKKIKKYCEKKNIVFLSSPFSIKAAKMLKRIGMNAWKIGSGEFFSKNLIKYISKFQQTMLLSTGLANYNDINKTLRFLKPKNKKIILLQCTSEYPSKIKRVGVNIVKEFQEKYNLFVGLSDHSGSVIPSINALNLGAKVVEVHVKLDNNTENPDQSSSIDLKSLTFLCNAREEIHTILKNPLKKNKLSRDQLKNRKIFTKSMCLNQDREKNYKIKINDITFKKPGTGIHYDKIKYIVGKKLKKKYYANRLLKMGDIKK